MDLYDVMQNHLGLFLLVLTRTSGIFIMAPFLGSRNIPVTVRAGTAVAIAVVLYPMVAEKGMVAIPSTLIEFAFVLLVELFVGWIIGFVASLVFSAIQMAGQFLDMQVGFGVVNVLDPTSGQQIPIIGSFKYNLAIIIFLVTNSFHILLTGLFESFTLVPVLGASFSPRLTELIVDLVWGIFTVAIKISLPVIVSILLTDVALGVLARTMPQMNIFVVGIPAKLVIGVFVLSIALPFYILFLDVAFNEMFGNVYAALRVLQP